MLRYRRLKFRDPRKGPAKVPSVLHPEQRIPLSQRQQESRNVPLARLKDEAQQMAHSIQRSFSKAAAARGDS